MEWAASFPPSAASRYGPGSRCAFRAGSAPSRSSGCRKTRSTSTYARAATSASTSAPRTRSTSATRSTSGNARPIANAWRPAARSAPSISRARSALAKRASTWCSISPRSRCCACPTGAIRADGDHVRVEPHLCAGCGGCATVCPSGAMTYAYPRVSDIGMRLKTLLSTYREAGGADACLLFHNTEAGRQAVRAVGRKAVRGGKGLPARAIPFEVFHVASIGLDTLLGAICYGASQVVVVSTKESEHYVAALREQMALGEVILNALGYEGRHFELIQEIEPLWELKPAATVAKPATFNLSPEKRTTLDFELDHLAKNAPRKVEEIPLPAGAPFGALLVNKQTCTLCKACIGACPESALLDAADAPRLRFIERNCVQCGLCAETCPEDAIQLVPRLLFGPQAKEAVTLNEAEPFHCVRCGKPFGTRQMVDSMLGKLGGHSMFAGDGALRRLQMCGDCRVVDMMENRAEATIFDFKK